MSATHRLVFTAAAIGAGLVSLAAPAHAAPSGSIKLCSDLEFSKCSTKVGPDKDIYLRVEFKKAVGSEFAAAFGKDDIPTSGKFALAIGKNADDENPIITYVGALMVSRFDKQKTLDLTLQAPEKTVEKIAAAGDDVSDKVPFNSIGTMGDIGISQAWAQEAVKFKNGDLGWEAFVFFVEANSDADPVLVASAKFTYAMSDAGRKKLTSGMNFYDNERFAKTADDGITTEVHKANVGKVVFGRKKMKKGHDDAGDLVTTAKDLAKGLYGRLYMKESFRNALSEHGQGKDVSDTWYHLHIESGDVKVRIEDKLAREEALTLTSFSLTLVPGDKADGEDMPNITRGFAWVVSMLKPGKHTIRVAAVLHAGETPIEVAAGELVVEIKAKDRDKVAKTWGQQLPGKGLFSDKKLEKSVRKILSKDYVALRAPNVWEERKNGFGQVTHRVTIVVTGYKEGGQCKQGVEMIQQDKTGSGFGPAHRSTESPWYGVEGNLPCQNLKK